MAPVIVAGLISAGAGIANSLITHGSNFASYSNSVDLMREQNRLNLQNWERQNAYNSPAAQMARYNAAGLNPNIIYGNSQQISSGNSGDVPAVQASQFKTNVPTLDVSTVINAALAQSQIAKLDAETKGQQIQNSYDQQSFGMRLETLQQQLANYQANRELTENKIKESGLSQETQSVVLRYLDDYQKAGLRYQYYSVARLEKEVQDLDYKVNVLNPLKKNELDASIQNIRAYTENLLQNTYLAGSLTLNAEEQREVIRNTADNLAKTYEEIEAKIGNIRAATDLTEKDIRNYVWTHLTGIGASAVGAGIIGASKGNAKRLPVNQRYTPYDPSAGLGPNYNF